MVTIKTKLYSNLEKLQKNLFEWITRNKEPKLFGKAKQAEVSKSWTSQRKIPNYIHLVYHWRTYPKLWLWKTEKVANSATEIREWVKNVTLNQSTTSIKTFGATAYQKRDLDCSICSQNPYAMHLVANFTQGGL